MKNDDITLYVYVELQRIALFLGAPGILIKNNMYSDVSVKFKSQIYYKFYSLTTMQ